MLNAKFKNKVITCDCIPLFDDNSRIADIIDQVKEKPIFRVGDGKETLVEILKKSVLSELPSRDLRGYLHLTDTILDIIHYENLVSK